MVHGISGGNNNDALRYLNSLNAAKETGKTFGTDSVKSNQPIDVTARPDKVGRTDLDNLSPYAGLVHFTQKAPAGSVESYAQATPEFGRWTGNYTISNNARQEAADYLSAYSTACQTYNDVAPHLQDNNSPFAELFG